MTQLNQDSSIHYCILIRARRWKQSGPRKPIFLLFDFSAPLGLWGKLRSGRYHADAHDRRVPAPAGCPTPV